jgi:hypothetical protein
MLKIVFPSIMKAIPMVKKIVLGFLCGAVCSIAPSAYAQASDASKLGGYELKPYFQGALGLQRLSSPSSTGMAMDLNASQTNNSVRAAVGVQINEHFGIEGTWFHLPSATLQTKTGDATYKGAAYVVSLTASVPVQKDVNLVGRLGVGRSDVDVVVPATTYKSFSRQDLTVWGLGIRFAVDKSKDVTIDYDNLGAVGKYALGDRVKTDMLSFGLRFKF